MSSSQLLSAMHSALRKMTSRIPPETRSRVGLLCWVVCGGLAGMITGISLSLVSLILLPPDRISSRSKASRNWSLPTARFRRHTSGSCPTIQHRPTRSAHLSLVSSSDPSAASPPSVGPGLKWDGFNG